MCYPAYAQLFVHLLALYTMSGGKQGQKCHFFSLRSTSTVHHSFYYSQYTDNFLAIVALPSEVQRSLTLIKEQDALQQASSAKVNEGISKILSDNSKLSAEDTSNLLDQIREGFFHGISHAEERVALAEHIHQSVKGHIVKLEDDLKHFEEEVRLAKMAEANRTIAHFDEQQEQQDSLQALSSVGAEKAKRRTKSKEELAQTGDAAGRKRSRGGLGAGNNGLDDLVNSARKDQPPTELEKQGEEATYCYCGQPSYGEMIGCDANTDCEIEWFHYACVGLDKPPKDQWFCPDCSARMARNPMAVGAKSNDRGAPKKPRPSFVK